MNDSTTAQPRAMTRGLQAIELASVTGEPLEAGALAAVTNWDFLVWVFGADEQLERPILASFVGHPKKVKHTAWAARAWWPDITADAGEANNYLTLNRYEPARGKSRMDAWYCRRELHAVAMYGLLLDDFKGDWRALPMAPTWVVETSPGSFQVVYLFAVPLGRDDMVLGRKLGQALIDKGWSDPAAGSPTTRFMRLPVGVNGKYDPPCRVQLRYLCPSNRYAAFELVAGLGLELKALRPHVVPPAEQLKGEYAEVQALVERTDVRALGHDDWIAWLHALRGSLGADWVKGEGWAASMSWSDSQAQIDETLRAYRTIDPANCRSGIEQLRRWAGKPDPTKAFEDLGEELTNGHVSPGAQASRQQAAAVADDAVKKAAKKPKSEFELIEDLPAVATGTPYLIKGLMHQKSLTVIFGASGAAKTFVAVDMAVHLAAGRDWFGMKVKESVGVIFIANEDPEGVQERLHACVKHLGVPLAKLPIALSLETANMNHPAGKTELVARIAAMKARLQARCPGVRHFVVMIDTMLAVWLGMDDNTPDGVGAVLADCKAMQREEMTVVLLHHTGKDESKGMRGHSSLQGATDCAMHLRYDKDRGQYVLALVKRRRGSVGDELAFRLQFVGIGFDADGEGLTTGVVVPLEEAGAAAVRGIEHKLSDGQLLAQQALMRAVAAGGELHDAGPVHGAHQAVNFETWRKAYYAMKASETYEDREAARKAFDRAFDHLVSHGVVGVDSSMYWTL